MLAIEPTPPVYSLPMADTPLLIAFDFDGTLYPLRPYDSEQRLMLLASPAHRLLQRRIAKRAVCKDMQGGMDFNQFTQAYLHMIGSKSFSLMDDVVQQILDTMEAAELDPLKEMALVPGVEMHIISCGTVNIATRFLQRNNLGGYFSQIHGKCFDESQATIGTPTSMVMGSQDKVRVLDMLIDTAISNQGARPFVVAIGDGPTDIPMLRHADLGIIIDWDGNGNQQAGLPTVGSIREAMDMIRTRVGI